MLLTEQARQQLAAAGLTEEQWVLANYGRPGGNWTGDACGCPDSRCIGSGLHHPADTDCGCLPALLGDWLDGDPYRFFAVKPPGPVCRIRRVGAYNRQAGRPVHRYAREDSLTARQRRRVRRKFNRTWF